MRQEVANWLIAAFPLLDQSSCLDQNSHQLQRHHKHCLGASRQ